ncbi:MAG TPA: hypothetical protein VFA12_20060 [Stellaceae bacterium]|nr:hypothetical protein [Stellaceae bacterium]
MGIYGRPIIYDQSMVRDYDHLWAWRGNEYARSQSLADLLGSTGTVVTGLGATPTAPASLTINLAAGDIYQLAQLDTTAYGSLNPDTTQTMMQGFAVAQTVLLSTSGLGAGQSRYALITASFSQADSIPSDDPTGGLLYYLNTVNPTGAPYSGPNNNNTLQNTRRQGVCTIGVTYGTVATTGSEVPPNAPGGAVGLYLIDLTFGQTQVNANQILVAGPSQGSNTPSNYPQAPFLAGLTQKPTVGTYAGNPNGNLAGTVVGTVGPSYAPNFCWDTTDGLMWVCSQTGNALTAKWVGGGNRTRLTANTTIYVNASTGNDSTADGTSAKPFRTLQAARNYAFSHFDGGGVYSLTFQCTGAFTAGLLASGTISGLPSVGEIWNFTSSSSIALSAVSTYCISAVNAAIQITGTVQLSSTGGGSASCVQIGAGGFILLNSTGIAFGAAVNQIYLTQGGTVELATGYTINGNAGQHVNGGNGSFYAPEATVCTITLTGTPAFTTFISLNYQSFVQLSAAYVTFSGGATGQRYNAAVQSYIKTDGGGASFLPGSTAGAVDATSVYN